MSDGELEASVETSDGWYSCFNGDDVRRFSRVELFSVGGASVGDFWLKVRWTGGGGAPSSRKGVLFGDEVLRRVRGSGRMSSCRGWDRSSSLTCAGGAGGGEVGAGTTGGAEVGGGITGGAEVGGGMNGGG